MVNRTGDVRQHSYPTHRGELTETTAGAQPPVRPANPWKWVRSSFLTIRGRGIDTACRRADATGEQCGGRNDSEKDEAANHREAAG